MTIGTKSVLFGAHCFFLHPWFVAVGWWKLYGFPWDPRLWVAFFVHDLGYLGKPNMDGPEGESHPKLGAHIMRFLFDNRDFAGGWVCGASRTARAVSPILDYMFGFSPYCEDWHDFSLYHSRYYAKSRGGQPSQLCFADKLSFTLTPSWLYLPMVSATGEINEYLKNAQKADSGHWKPTGYDKRLWHAQLCEYMTKWVDEHKDGAADTWTDAKRHAKTATGVWQ